MKKLALLSMTILSLLILVACGSGKTSSISSKQSTSQVDKKSSLSATRTSSSTNHIINGINITNLSKGDYSEFDGTWLSKYGDKLVVSGNKITFNHGEPDFGTDTTSVTNITGNTYTSNDGKTFLGLDPNNPKSNNSKGNVNTSVTGGTTDNPATISIILYDTTNTMMSASINFYKAGTALGNGASASDTNKDRMWIIGSSPTALVNSEQILYRQ